MSRDAYEIVIGLEVHVELKTKAKIFCSCTTSFGADVNTHVCPVCLGLPGVLPVLNKKVVEFAIKAGLALDCEISSFSKFDRKNYFYPDLPKNFQTSQYDLPICFNGHLDIEVESGKKRVGITRIHIEEDAGKLTHGGETITSSAYSLLDYNRSGVPLLEIVSEPDMRSPEEARAYLEKLKAILEYTEVSDCKMEEGSLRCDANISIMPKGSLVFGTRAEIKNMNSFRALERALNFEIERQIQLVEKGQDVIQETRTWDDKRSMTFALRSKEEAHDYRYFPEPDLPPLVISPKWVEEIRGTLPELPEARKKRLMKDYELPLYDARVITSSKGMADYFEACAALYPKAKIISNWLMGDLSRLLNSEGKTFSDCPVTPEMLTEMLQLIDQCVISGKIAKTVFEEMYKTGKRSALIVKEKGLEQISDQSENEFLVEQVLQENLRLVEDYRAGKEKVLGFLVGQVMNKSKGKANPALVNELLKRKIRDGSF
jgi:aspartyl-tRNA(Asn)/glutamyl-tRNA(Gln) amidotransferase subunit B